MTKPIIALVALLMFFPCMYAHASSHGNTAQQAGKTAHRTTPEAGIPASEIVEKLNKRYSGEHFSADFHQESVLSALGISDTAEGKAWFSHPGRMRWEYHYPDRHAIITDGETLWIHRPEENQIIKGNASTYFGDGKGAGFLANFDLITESFDVSLADETAAHWRMELIPHEEQYELAAIYLLVNRQTLDIDQVISRNIHNDTTTITFGNFTFTDEPDSSLFEFEIPRGADVILMD